jgi:hypothetical protein
VDGREQFLKAAPTANPSGEDSYYTARFSADEKLAEHVEGILKHEKGLLVQYGVAHTLQDNNLVPRDAGKQDMDGALRSKGIGVLVIDAYHGQQSINCTPLMTAGSMCGNAGDAWLPGRAFRACRQTTPTAMWCRTSRPVR